MKKAFLVETTLVTRIVTEVNDNGDILDWDNFVDEVTKNLNIKINNNEVGENIEKITEDKEVPYEANI